MSSPPASFRPARRQVLGAGIVGAGALLVGLPTLAACGSDDSGPAAPDALLPLARRARQDAADADAVAAAHSDLAATVGAVAADRIAHAEALEAEIRRAAGDDEEPAAPPSAPVATPPSPDRGTARSSVLDMLRIAETEASRLVLGAPANRAAMLGSLAACCASHQAVL